MNFKVLSVLSFCVVLCSCKDTNEHTINDEVITENSSRELTESDISKFDYVEFGLDGKTEQVIANWQEYHQIQDVVNAVKSGDLVFFSSNVETIKTLLKDLKENIPEAVNTPATLARILVLETKIYKLRDLYNLSTTSKAELSEEVKGFLVSFSNLNFQMNKKLERDSQNIQKPQ